jgi:replicative superfamily II helicase
MANNIRNTKLKHSFFVRWLHYKRGNSDKLKSRNVEKCSHEVKARSVVIVEEDDCRPTSIGQNVTPDKIVPLDVPETVQHTKCVDDNENQLKGTEKINLLIPIGHQRRKTGSLSNPNLALKMNQRKEKREKGREQLRQRYEQKAIEKQQRLEEERLRREEAETKVQREFVQRKTVEEQRKKMAAERWKRACRLAALHYQMSLQKRMLLQWKRIFQVRDFHERKVRRERAAILNSFVESRHSDAKYTFLLILGLDCME